MAHWEPRGLLGALGEGPKCSQQAPGQQDPGPGPSDATNGLPGLLEPFGDVRGNGGQLVSLINLIIQQLMSSSTKSIRTMHWIISRNAIYVIVNLRL